MIHLTKQFLAVVIFSKISIGCQSIENVHDVFKISRPENQKQRYIDDLEFIAKFPRDSGSKHHKIIQNLCAIRFKQLGFQVELHDYGSGINVIGIRDGGNTANEKIIVSAHYDSVPQCNGADDNASGVAGVFETARILASGIHDRTLVIACWDEEERGMVGSTAYVAREKNYLSIIKMSYVYEMIGYTNNLKNSQQTPLGFDYLYPLQVEFIQKNQNRGDFISLVYDDNASKELLNVVDYAQKQNLPLIQVEVSSSLKSSPSLHDLRRSDHAAFWDAGYPAMMITDTANFRNQNYHCLKGRDNIESLDIDFALKTINTVTKLAEESLNNGN